MSNVGGSGRAFLWLLALAALVACNPGGSSPPLPPTGFAECPATGNSELITPEVACAYDEAGARTIVFGYRNDGDAAVIPSGTEGNRYTPEPDPRLAKGAIRPPSSFLPGAHPAAFFVTYLALTGDLQWQVGSRTADSAGAPLCSVVRNAEGVTLGAPASGSNTPPSIAISRDPGRILAATIQPSPTPLAGRAVGETVGAMGVSSDGSATYSIPIDVPAGRAGMHPELALTYGSRNGNGPLGVGWNIAGLSQISRCSSQRTDPNSPLATVVSAPVGWTEEDALCLDGDQLVGNLNPGLSPLHDPYTRVTVLARDASGPTSLSAELKNGRILTFGGTGATIEGETVEHTSDGIEDANAAKHVRYAWLLSEVRDRMGNAVRYHYGSADLGYGQGCESGPRPCRAYEKRPTSITYTHLPGGAGAVKRIDFEWDDDRSDTEIAWVSGFPLKRSGRLRRILVNGPAPVETGPLRSYALSYVSGALSGRSLLATIEECDSGGACRPPTAFTYEDGAPTFSPDATLGTANGANAPGSTANIIVADFTGDGLDDLIYQRATNWFFRRNITAPGSATQFEYEVALKLANDADRGTPIPPFAADVTHDGKADLVFPRLHSYISNNATCMGTAYQVLEYLTLEFDNTKLQFNGGEPVKGKFGSGCGDKLQHSFHVDLDGDDRLEEVRVTLGFSDSYWHLGDAVERTLLYAPAPISVSPLTVPVTGARSWSLLAAREDRYYLAARPDRRRTPLLAGALFAFGDMNLDGMADALMRMPGTTETSVIASVGTSFRRIDIPTPIMSDGRLLPWLAGSAAVRFDYLEDGRAVCLVDPDFGGAPAQRLTTPMLRPNGLSVPSWSASPPIASGGTVADLRPFMKQTRVLDANGDGLDDLLLLTNNEFRIYKRDGKRADMLTSVRTGLGDTTRVEYRTVRAGFPDPFLAECGDAAGVACGTRAVHVVSRIERHAGTPVVRATQYEFSRASTDFAVGTFLGYASTLELDEQTGTKTIKLFGRRTESFFDATDGAWASRRFPFANAPTRVDVQTPLENGRLLRNTTTFDYGKAGAESIALRMDGLRPPSSRSITSTPDAIHRVSEELDGSSLKRVALIHESHTAYEYDRYGNIKSQTTNFISTGEKTTTTNNWRVDPVRWLVSQPLETTESSTVSTALVSDSARRTTTYDPDPATGLLRAATLQPSSGADMELRLGILRNGAGQVTSTIIADTLGRSRRSDIAYDEIDGTYPSQHVDALGYATQFVYHAGLGVLAETTDPNGVRRRFRYDAFGQIRRILGPQCTQGPDFIGTSCSGTTTVIDDEAPAVAGAAFAVKRSAVGSPITTVHYDALGRAVRSDTVGFDGNLISTLTNYDRVFLDAVSSVSEVLTPSTSPVSFFISRVTSFLYDRAGRLIRRTSPDKSFTSWTYNGLFTTTTDPVGATRIIEHDGLGRTVRLLEELEEAPAAVGTKGSLPGGTKTLQTHYRYGAFARLLYVVDPKGNRVSFTYDSVGRRRSTSDGDTGLTQFSYDAFGQVVAETDSLGRVREFAYDALGRQIGTRAIDGLSCYQYDGSENGVGRLSQAISYDGAADSRVATTQSFSHDLVGRVYSTTQVVGGGPTLSYFYFYDIYGRPSSVTYPAVGGTGLTVRYGYNGNGYLDRVADFTSPPTSGEVSDAPILWQANEANTVGQITKETFGSGVVVSNTFFPNTGLIARSLARNASGAVVQDLEHEWRSDRRLKRRVDRSDVTAAQTDTYSYDSLKRLTEWRGDWGGVQYSYDDIGNLERRITSAGGVKTDDERFVSGKPAILSPGKPSPPADPIHAVIEGPGGKYSYNAVGDQESAPGRTVSWTTFHLPRQVVGLQSAQYSYDASGGRVRKSLSDGGITTYAGGLYELREAAGGVENVYTVTGAGRAIAQISRAQSGNASRTSTIYFHTDHLGSPHAITDGGGTRVALRTHEPFGRRVSRTSPMTPVAESVPELTRSFTGHESEDEFTLINMRGRIYDPKVGRFVSADPIVGLSSQTLNRFSYVANDPINATDPTGMYAACDTGSCANAGDPPKSKEDSSYYSSSNPGSESGTYGAPRLKPPEPTPSAAPPKPGAYVPYAPMNGGVGGITPFNLGAYTGTRLPTIGSGYKLASKAWGSASGVGAGAGSPIEGGESMEGPARLSTRRFAGPRYAGGATATPDKSWLDKEWVDYNAWYSPNRAVTKYGYSAAYGSLWVASKASEVGLMVMTLGLSNYVVGGRAAVAAEEAVVAEEALVTTGGGGAAGAPPMGGGGSGGGLPPATFIAGPGGTVVKTGLTPTELLMPGGARIGTAGAAADVRTIGGGTNAAEMMYEQLSVGGTPYAGTYPGPAVTLPGGGFVGMRTISTASGARGVPAATIEVNVTGVPIRKLKFEF